MQRRIESRLAFGLLSVILTAGMAPAHAAMDEVVVTAERREQPLLEVPVAVSAFQASQITGLQIDALKDIGTNVPNLQIYTITAGAQAAQVHARGASVQNPGFNLSESPVAIYQDDVYFGRLASANLDLTDIERIEVLRGPQGTLYGRNTIAGAIKIISRTPADDFWANASAGVGNYETTKLTASVGGPIKEGELAGSIAGLWDNRTEGWQNSVAIQDGQPVTVGSAGAYENTALRGKLHWYGAEDLDVVLTGWFVRVTNDGYNGVPYVPFANTTPNANFDPAPPGSHPLGGFYDNFDPGGVNFGSSTQSGGSVAINYDLGNGTTFRSITAASGIDDKFGFDLAGGGFLGIPGAGGLLINSDSTFNQQSQEFQLLGTAFSDRLDWLLGLYYLHEDGDQTFSGGFAGGGPAAFSENVHNTTNSYAIYGQGTYNLTEAWSVTAGLRWTTDDKDYQNICTGVFCVDDQVGPGDTTPGTESVDLNHSWSETTGKVAVEYRIDQDQNTYLSWSQGFQAGGFRTLCFGNLTSECGGSTFGPQKVNSVELGYKAELVDRTVSLNLAVFDAMYQDIQQIVIRQLPGLTIFPIDNIGDVDVYGIELEVHWAPTERINIFGDMGIQESNFGSVDPASPPGGLTSPTPDISCPNRPDQATAQCAAPTRDLPSNPKWQGKVGFDYTIPLQRELEFFYGADLYHTDSYYSEARNQVKLQAYSRINGFLGIGGADKKWRAVLTAKNIGNTKDNVSGLFSQGFTNTRTPLPPVEYMLTFKVAY